METLSTRVKNHCNKHNGCVKCPFVGNQCVAPVSDRDFNDWIIKMQNLINAIKVTR